MPTFREAAQRTFEANRTRWSPKTAHNWTQQLERHTLPVLGDLPVDQIGREHVLRVLTPLWGVKLDTPEPTPADVMDSAAASAPR